MCQACLAEFALNSQLTKSDGYTPINVTGALVPSSAHLESMQADGVLEYIVDHAVGVDVTASSLASRYDVSVKLGEGAFSQVWRGQRRDGGGGGDACALKCIGLESLDDDDEALEMLANEVAALRAAASGLGEEQRRHVLGPPLSPPPSPSPWPCTSPCTSPPPSPWPRLWPTP